MISDGSFMIKALPKDQQTLNPGNLYFIQKPISMPLSASGDDWSRITLLASWIFRKSSTTRPKSGTHKSTTLNLLTPKTSKHSSCKNHWLNSITLLHKDNRPFQNNPKPLNSQLLSKSKKSAIPSNLKRDSFPKHLVSLLTVTWRTMKLSGTFG